MQISYWGIAFVGALFGAFLALVHRAVRVIPAARIRSAFEAHVALKLSVVCVMYADPAQVVPGNIALLAALALMYVTFRPAYGNRAPATVR